MDVDAFVAANRPAWQRLDQLAGSRKLTAAESDELLDLYERTSTHLSLIRSEAPDPSLVRYLSALLTRARIGATSARTLTWGAAAQFVTRTFPAALYRLRWWWLGVVAANVVVTIGLIVWTLHHPEMYAQVLSKDEIDHLVNQEIEGYYSEYAHHQFATLVWVNNAWVSAMCIGLGALGLPVIYLLWQNVFNLAILAALMTEHGRAGLFWGLVLPHGLLELSAVFVAAATGLRLFWSWVSPGDRTRAQSFAREGRIALAVALGLVGVLLVSGLIEGFVTPSGLPTWARVGIGVVAEAGFLAYIWITGRRAYAQGYTGDVDDRDLDDRVAIAT